MILITGGAGFIGSHLTKELLNQGKDVVVVDNFDPFYNPRIKRKNIETYLDHPAFNLVEGDIQDREVIDKIFQKYPVKKVVHLAAKAGVRSSITDPFVYERVNFGGTLNLLEVCKEYSVQNFIFASSSSVYGNIQPPFSENTSSPLPVSPYGVTKLAGEFLCQTYHHLYGIPVICLRIFTVYGPSQRPEMAIYKFTRCIQKEKEVPVFGQGEFKRDYTYIDDLIQGIILALNHKCEFEVINLGSSNPIDLLSLIKIIEFCLNKKAKINFLPSQPGDPLVTFADIRKANKLLGYQPRVSINEGVKRFIRWYLENLDWLDRLI